VWPRLSSLSLFSTTTPPNPACPKRKRTMRNWPTCADGPPKVVYPRGAHWWNRSHHDTATVVPLALMARVSDGRSPGPPPDGGGGAGGAPPPPVPPPPPLPPVVASTSFSMGAKELDEAVLSLAFVESADGPVVCVWAWVCEESKSREQTVGQCAPASALRGARARERISLFARPFRDARDGEYTRSARTA